MSSSSFNYPQTGDAASRSLRPKRKMERGAEVGEASEAHTSGNGLRAMDDTERS
jgi:hypothetical protein